MDAIAVGVNTVAKRVSETSSFASSLSPICTMTSPVSALGVGEVWDDLQRRTVALQNQISIGDVHARVHERLVVDQRRARRGTRAGRRRCSDAVDVGCACPRFGFGARLIASF